MNGPSDQDVKAVRAVLHQQPRLRQLEADLKSIDVLMRVASSSEVQGPAWFYLASGELSSSVKEAARRCHAVAATQLAVADDLHRLSIPQDDRQNLVTLFRSDAAAWDARGTAWAAPGKPDVGAITRQIAAHQRDALAAAKQVKAYLRDDG
jgi:hypothetical protein